MSFISLNVPDVMYCGIVVKNGKLFTNKMSIANLIK